MKKLSSSRDRQAPLQNVPACLCILCLSVLLQSCALPCVAPGPGQAHIISDVPFYAQGKNQCGPASLAGVLGHWGIPVPPEEIARDIYSDSANGTLTMDMVIYAQERGLTAEQYSGSMSDLRKKIDEGYPFIVLVDTGLFVFEMSHFMVITGYSPEVIIANSGRERSKCIPEKDFMKAWEKTNFWTLFISPKGEKR